MLMIYPHDKTLVMDTDYIVSNDLFAKAFESTHDLMMYRASADISGWRDEKEFKLISETSILPYWATCIIFTKCKQNKITLIL